MERQRVRSGAPWEERVGYSRAVRAGNLVFVSGTTGVGRDGRAVDPEDAGAQTRRALEIVAEALEQLGGSLADVVRVTIYTVDLALQGDIAPVVKRALGEVRPAMTAVEVASLIDPDLLVEIEVTAVLDAAEA